MVPSTDHAFSSHEETCISNISKLHHCKSISSAQTSCQVSLTVILSSDGELPKSGERKADPIGNH